MNNSVKKLFGLVMAFALAISCSKDDGPSLGAVVDDETDGGDIPGEVTISGKIGEDTTWKADTIYLLEEKVFVDDNSTLTIEAGTIIKGKAGTGTKASALIIARGSKIIAEGTAEKPIIFTSEKDNIEKGSQVGDNLTSSNLGLWGGLVILGNAPCSLKNDVKEVVIEGVAGDEEFARYGGDKADDNSGVLKYISIRHGGAEIGEDNELNGLTLGGVGSGTTISNIEVVASKDDGIELFGGTVNVSNLVIYAQGDDGIDIDQGYKGTISNFAILAGETSDHGLEVDGPEGSATGSFIIDGGILYGSPNQEGEEYADYRSKATGTTKNIIVGGFDIKSDVELDNNAVAQNFLDGKLKFENWEVTGFDESIFIEMFDQANGESAKITGGEGTFTDRAATWTTKIEEKELIPGIKTPDIEKITIKLDILSLGFGYLGKSNETKAIFILLSEFAKN